MLLDQHFIGRCYERQNLMRSAFTLNITLALVVVSVNTIYVLPASGALTEWLAEVAAGTPAGYTNTGITSPIVADIGTYSEATNGGITYEFIVNATNDGASSSLLGNFAPPAVGDAAALKWEQWNNTLNYGVTAFGVLDYDSGVANTPNVDTHVAFVNNATNTLLYVNGSLAATINGASPTLGGTIGIGQAYSPSGSIDPLVGRIIGVAIYDAALGAAEIGAHARAFAIPEPSSLILLVGGAACGLLRRRRR
jgi:hypothetical protein